MFYSCYSPLAQFDMGSGFGLDEMAFGLFFSAVFLDSSVGLMPNNYKGMPYLSNSSWSFYYSMYSMLYNFCQVLRINGGILVNIFMNLLLVMTSTIGSSNMFGLTPYGFVLTSHISVTLTISLLLFLNMNISGMYIHNDWFFTLFLPTGTPKAMLPLMVPMEVLSYFSSVLSLSIRLFANMMSGHTLLHILIAFLYKSFNVALFNMIFIDFFFYIVLQLMVFMETGISVLQMYVFIMLSCLYLLDTHNIYAH